MTINKLLREMLHASVAISKRDTLGPANRYHWVSSQKTVWNNRSKKIARTPLSFDGRKRRLSLDIGQPNFIFGSIVRANFQHL
jgi:hypothetical protein